MTDYYLKLTTSGLVKIAAAGTGGPVVSLTHMAAGDGNGNPVMPPTGSETALVHETYRDQINALYVNTNDSAIMMAEFIIPSATGGWAIHEVGIFDAEGDLFAYGNFPATFKPIAESGSTRDMVVSAAVKVNNTAVIELVIDTSIVLATRQWVLSTITGAYLIPGGTTGQILKKVSNADGDYDWFDPADVNIIVDVIKEEQTAAASQDTFTLTVCTTDGVAVYIEGVRVHNFTVLNTTQLQLLSGLSAGTKVLFVQNEPNEPLKMHKLLNGRVYFMGQI